MMDHTLALITKSQQGDKKARDTVFEENTGLIYSVAKRFVGRGVEMEDLIQIGSIGLLKAVDHFNASFEVKFSTYAVPMIAGEIKRYLRDDGILKVSRSLKENCVRIYSAREKLEKELGREPVMEEIAQSAQLSVDEVVMSLESGAEVESLHKIIYQGDGNDISLMDRLQEKENGQDAALNRIFLDEILKKLDARERQLIYMRYFKDMTQTEIAAEMGISQVQVSRMEKRILKQLKDQT
ncbi:SigB/SigF/SigG family RNA polymerase sigma factor [Ruminococcus sp. AF37-6AT]|nr:SigF/SigG family RNA polymerase sporulation sigma factor [Ruminococcus sp.]RGI63827.1 SigB/SigF/SigG family RNA polymerase sigma factor [Ruminococcus sp. TM10-9AT]RHD95365.1 SigB/SigF/SigG family RNA polymerase sigma factor [Ruminococcus sp. AM30-15AC]RHG56612.1 SigB/SigF/SigG family RNA polymerase sigma factor [Ruminococcus sp. AM22-13]RHL50925.1 SigB/SigF/SigG family RNA polymerase sigma factor [Ruminococcus sp. AF37-6AT]RHO88373.1 SigB/SigF/SigG family RNA polymerase sigma factor [Rumino